MMGMKRWIGGLVTAATAGVLLAGGTAFADTSIPPPASTSTSSSTSSTAPVPHKGEGVCTKRIPALLARIDTLTAKINGDVNTRGSTAWLTAQPTRPAPPGTARARTC